VSSRIDTLDNQNINALLQGYFSGLYSANLDENLNIPMALALHFVNRFD
jgi:hypothetical protein